MSATNAPIIAEQIPVPDLAPATGLAAPTPTRQVTVEAEATQDYAAGSADFGLWNAAVFRTLPLFIDDITADFGHDLYRRMLHDPRIAAEINNLKAAILEDGVTLAPAIDDPKADGHLLAAEIATLAARMLDELEIALDDVLWDMLGAVAFGHRIAEQSYRVRTVAGVPRLMLTALRVKPPEVVSLVVDAYLRVIGLLALIPGRALPSQPGALVDPAQAPNLLPRAKFAVYTSRPQDSDPRGTSVLRAAYTPWSQKAQGIREHLKYLSQFASPSLIGILGPGARNVAETDASGALTGKVTKAVDALLNQLLAFHNGTAIAVPYQTEIKELYSQGEGRAFLAAFALWNQEITLAISGQTLATTEGEHQARAAAQVHQDTAATITRQAKRSVQRMIRRDVLQSWVRWNWGDDTAEMLTPRVTLGSTEEEDITPLMNAVAALERVSWFTPSQKPGIDVAMKIPQRTPEETATDTERFNAPPVAPALPAGPEGGPPGGSQGNQPPRDNRQGQDGGAA